LHTYAKKDKTTINKNTPTCQKKKYKWSNPSSDDDSDQKRVDSTLTCCDSLSADMSTISSEPMIAIINYTPWK